MSQLKRGAKSRFMYIEDKSGGLTGAARIGRVTFSRTGKTVYYAGRAFQTLSGRGFKANYFDVETLARLWISGPRRDGCDRLYGEATPVEVDADVREEYWTVIRGLPERRTSARREAGQLTASGKRKCWFSVAIRRRASRTAGEVLLSGDVRRRAAH